MIRLAAAQAMRAVYADIKQRGSFSATAVPLMPFSDLTQLPDFVVNSWVGILARDLARYGQVLKAAAISAE